MARISRFDSSMMFKVLKGLAAVKRVVHEVQGPGDVLLGWRNQGLLEQFREPALGTPWQV
jgi:hypothetical protein